MEIKTDSVKHTRIDTRTPHDNQLCNNHQCRPPNPQIIFVDERWIGNLLERTKNQTKMGKEPADPNRPQLSALDFSGAELCGSAKEIFTARTKLRCRHVQGTTRLEAHYKYKSRLYEKLALPKDVEALLAPVSIRRLATIVHIAVLRSQLLLKD